tara:strand:- start:2995 stop:3375 length:381 start_codon:yes stop_codon:yes gene_type:complete
MTIASVTGGDIIDPAWGNSVADAVNPSAWTAVTFQNSWQNFSGSYQSVQYRKVNDVVEVRGFMKSGTLDSTAFTLPAGFRPPSAFQIPSLGGGVFSKTIVQSDGDVIPSGGSTSYFSTVFTFSIST